VITSTFTWNANQNNKPQPIVDWHQPGAGEMYFNAKYGKKTNTPSDIVAVLNAANDRKLNHVIGSGLRDFVANWNRSDQPTSFKTISTSLEQNQQAVEIESKLLNLMR
jgi:hypothetical protein